MQQVNSMPSLSYHNCFSVLPTCPVNEETVEPSIDVQNSVSELLVATDVKVCWQVCLYLQHVPSDQIIPTPSDQRTPPSTHSICSMGYYQCGLHCRAATICRARLHYGCRQFRHKACTFHFHGPYDLCRWSCTPFPQPHVETSRSPSESHL